MSRLQKKCYIVSAGFHLLLLLILFLGSAFLSAPNKTDSIQDLKFIPTKLVDALVSGGGTPQAAPPVATPPTPASQARSSPAPEKTKEPDPPKDVTKEPKQLKTPSESLEPKKPKLAAESLRLVSRNHDSKPKKSPPSDAEERNKLADARREASELISQTANGIARGTSSATKVNDPEGPGGGGESYASYEAWVRDVYERAWVRPDDATSEDPITKVSITIGKDGRVVSSKIIKRSGDPQMDASVQRALERVTTVGRPFPEGAKDSERTYIIPFNMKKQLGRA